MPQFEKSVTIIANLILTIIEGQNRVNWNTKGAYDNINFKNIKWAKNNRVVKLVHLNKNNIKCDVSTQFKESDIYI